MTPTETTPKIDLKGIPTADLLKALEARENEKKQNRQAYKDLVEETIPKAVFELCVISEKLSNVKKSVFEKFEQILTIKNEVYGIKEKQRSHTFSNDKVEIVIGYRINDGWDDTATAGIQKVNNYISSLAKDPNSAALVETVFNLLKKDAKGNLKGSRVLELQKLTEKFNDPEFTDGVKIISEAYKPVRSSWFIEASVFDSNGQRQSIPLSMSAVDFPAGYSFDFFNEPTPEQDERNN